MANLPTFKILKLFKTGGLPEKSAVELERVEFLIIFVCGIKVCLFQNLKTDFFKWQ